VIFKILRRDRMIAKIQKWGNSQGIRFPRQVLRQANISIGDEVDVEVHDGEILVKPTNTVRGKYKLSELLAKKTKHMAEVDWGQAKGQETW
jgi:antitoxin MazE